MSELVQITGPEIIEATPAKLVEGTPAEALHKFKRHAEILYDYVEKQKLYKHIGPKKHLYVQAWTFLGSLLGVFPACVWTKQIEGGWMARVEARTLSGSLVGAAEAICMRTESNWKSRDEYALLSMAQTRATSKALRQPLDFIVTLAGYEGTPAEEMPVDLEPVLGESIRRVQKKKQDWTNTHPGHCTLKGCKEIVMEYQSESKAFPGRFYMMCEGAYNQRLEMLDQGSSNKEANAAVEKHYREWSEPWPRKATTATDGGGPIF